MKIYALFAQRRESYPGEYAPELLVAWDEFAIDENGEEFGRRCHEELDAIGAENMIGHAYVTFEVDQAKIRGLCMAGETEIEARLIEKDAAP